MVKLCLLDFWRGVIKCLLFVVVKLSWHYWWPHSTWGCKWQWGWLWARGFMFVLSNMESHFHIVRGTASSHSPMEVILWRGGNEVVTMTRPELEATWCWCEWPESDGEVHQLMGPIANGNDFGIGLCDPTRIIFLFCHTIDDVLFLRGVCVCARLIDRAHNVDLIILPRVVATIDLDDVVMFVSSKEGVRGVPMDVVHTSWVSRRCHMQQCQHHEEGVPLRMRVPLQHAGQKLQPHCYRISVIQPVKTKQTVVWLESWVLFLVKLKISQQTRYDSPNYSCKMHRVFVNLFRECTFLNLAHYLHINKTPSRSTFNRNQLLKLQHLFKKGFILNVCSQHKQRRRGEL